MEEQAVDGAGAAAELDLGVAEELGGVEELDGALDARRGQDGGRLASRLGDDAELGPRDAVEFLYIKKTY